MADPRLAIHPLCDCETEHGKDVAQMAAETMSLAAAFLETCNINNDAEITDLCPRQHAMALMAAAHSALFQFYGRDHSKIPAVRLEIEQALDNIEQLALANLPPAPANMN